MTKLKYLALFLAIAALVWTVPVRNSRAAAAVIYYVDSAVTDTNVASATCDFTTYNPATFATDTGSDCVYKTIADVNAKSPAAGDSVLFRKGQTWREQLTVPASGSAGLPITYGAYGTGDAPKIYGSTQLSSWTQTNIPAVAANLINQSFEGAGYDNSESWSETVGSGSVVNEDSTAVARPTGGGDQVLLIQKVSPNYNASAEFDHGSDWAIFSLDAYVRVAADGLGDGGVVRLIVAISSEWGSPWKVELLRSGTARYFRFTFKTGAGWTAVDSSAINYDQWYNIKMRYDITNHTYAAKLDNTVIMSGALSAGHDSGTQRVWLGDDDASVTLTAYFDLIKACDSATEYPGAGDALPANTWKAAMSVDPNTIWYPDGTPGIEESTLAAVNAANEWFWDSRQYLVVYSVDDPGVVEAAVRNTCIRESGADTYITIDGFEIAYSITEGIRGHSYWTIQNNTVHHIGAPMAASASGIQIFNPVTDGTGSNAIIQNNTVHHAGRRGISISRWGTGTVASNIIQNNTVYDCYHNGIDLSSAYGGGNIIRYNTVYATAGYPAATYSMGGIYVDGGSGSVTDTVSIYYNIVYNMAGQGIQLGTYTSNALVYNNAVYAAHASAATKIGIQVAATGSSGHTVKNNAVYASGGEAFRVDDNATLTAVANNAWYRTESTYVYVEGAEYHSDDQAAYIAATGWDTNGKWVDPLFVSSSDFHLQATSPCINAGIGVGLTTDYAGTAIMCKPEIGAYEYPLKGCGSIIVIMEDELRGRRLK